MEPVLSTEWILAAAAVFGALWGSFANVVIARWPREMSVVTPGSHCFSCGKPVAWYDNIPIFSYLLLRGRCRHCGQVFSARYAVVEVAAAALSVAVAQQVMVFGAHGGWAALGDYLVWFSLVLALLIVAFIDAEHYLIPDAVVLPMTAVGVAVHALWWRHGWVDYALAAAAAYAVMRLVFVDGYALVTGAPGMGLGDAKLVAMVGAFCGAYGVLFTVMAGAVQGLVVGTALVLVRRRDGLDKEPVFDEERDANGAVPAVDPRLRKARIPFGPFLALGALEYVFFGAAVYDWWFSAVNRLAARAMGW